MIIAVLILIISTSAYSETTIKKGATSVSSTSFTVATCLDQDGGAITLADNMWRGTIWRFYTNGGSACNVIDQKVLISTFTSGGVIGAGTIAPVATPNTSNCGIYNP